MNLVGQKSLIGLVAKRRKHWTMRWFVLTKNSSWRHEAVAQTWKEYCIKEKI